VKNERTRTKMLSAHTTTQKNQIFDVPQGYFSPTTLPEELKKRKKMFYFIPFLFHAEGLTLRKNFCFLLRPRGNWGNFLF